MLDNPRSHGLWEHSAPDAPQTSPLDRDIRADVAIVGAGYTGLSAALHLAESGLDAVVLEGVEIGFGGAGRNVGLINAGLWLMPDGVTEALGEPHGERMLTALGDGPALVMDIIDRHAIACELERQGTLHCAVGPSGQKEIMERARQWQRRGARVRLLDEAETRQRIGSSAYAGSLLDARAGTLQPLAYARGLATAALKAGARIHNQSPVVHIEQGGRGWQVGTPQGSVTAKWVLVCTDAYSSGPLGSIRREQIHLPYFNLATSPLPADLLKTILPNREGVWDTKEVLSSFRLDHAGRLVFGSVGALRNSGHAIHTGWSRRALKRLFPQLGDITFEHEWFGQIGMTTDAIPRYHRLGQNMVGFSGYNGRGISPGTVFGRMLARLVTGEMTEEELPVPVTDPVEPAFRRTREVWYEAGAQIAHLAFDRIGAKR